MNLTLLGRLPLDPRIGQSCVEGRSFLDTASPATNAFVAITDKIVASLKGSHGEMEVDDDNDAGESGTDDNAGERESGTDI